MKFSCLILFITVSLFYQQIQGHPTAESDPKPPTATANEDVISMEELDSDNEEADSMEEFNSDNEEADSMEELDSNNEEANSMGDSTPQPPGELQETDLSEKEVEEASDDFEVADSQQFRWTRFHSRIHFYCSTGNALYYMYSYHSNSKEDRRWRFGCKKISSRALTNCHWVGGNALDQMFIGQCPYKYAVTRFYGSKWHSGTRDRRFWVRCCRANTLTGSCGFTSYVNKFDGVLRYTAGSKYAITGIFSHHQNSKEDRTYVVRYCKYNYNC